MPTYGAPPPPPSCPSGLILWAPVAWYDNRFQILRPRDPSDSRVQQPVWEDEVPDAWMREGGELMVLQAKRRPALVVSTDDEHQARRAVRLLPLYKVSEERGWYQRNEAAIREDEKPGLFWLDDVPIEGHPEPRVVDCARMVRHPLVNINSGTGTRIATLDPDTLLAIKRHWSKFVLLSLCDCFLPFSLITRLLNRTTGNYLWSAVASIRYSRQLSPLKHQ